MQKLTKKYLQEYSGTNGEYYSQFLERYQTSPTFLSWNSAAFFVLPFWLAYRKLWIPLTVVFVLQLLLFGVVSQLTIGTAFYEANLGLLIHSLEQLFDPLVLLLVLIPFSFIAFGIALFSNSLYLKKAEKSMQSVDLATTSSASQNPQSIGKSKAAIFAAFAIFILIEALSWKLVDIRLNAIDEFYAIASPAYDLKQSEVGNGETALESPKIIELREQLSNYDYYEDNTNELEKLIEPYADLSSLTKADELHKPLEYLLLNNKFSKLSKLVEKNINIKQFALHHDYELVKHAFNHREWYLLKFLSEKGGYSSEEIDLMQKINSYEEYRPLQHAIEDGQLDIVRWMLEKNIPVEARFYKGKSPLILAVIENNIEVVKLLLSKGANPDYQPLNSKSARLLALELEDNEINNLFSTFKK